MEAQHRHAGGWGIVSCCLLSLLICINLHFRYHTSASNHELYKTLRLPAFMVLGPYSYNASPCELLFAAFKSVDINPRHIPTGKTHFPQVVRLVMDRLRRIPRSHVVLHYHHCLLEAYRFLVY